MTVHEQHSHPLTAHEKLEQTIANGIWRGYVRILKFSACVSIAVLLLWAWWKFYLGL